MNFRFSEKEIALRQEIREFLAKELPPGWAGYGQGEEYGTEEGWQAARTMSKKLAQKGWLTIAWPKEYGGLEAPFTEYIVYLEEMNYHRVPGIDMGIGGVSWVASSLMLFGSEEQKRKHLPRIARAEEFWCTGYSEPGAGSDLAALQCRAIVEGDSWLVNGQKVWTSGAHIADYCWLAARTDANVPKHRGISMFIVDMKTPGITIRPLPNMAGHSSFNEVFFDEVRIPRENLVGEKNSGWHYLVVALDYERASLVGLPARVQRNIDELVGFAKQDKARAGDQLIRHKLAEATIECQVCRILCYKVAWMQSKGLAPTSESAVAKTLVSELGMRVANTGMQILGLYSQLPTGSRFAQINGIITDSYLDTIGMTIAGGTSEINRNVIATRGLGLPRS